MQNEGLIKLTNLETFWVLCINQCEYLMYEYKLDKLPFDDINYSEIESLVDVVVGLPKNKYGYVTIMADTTSRFFKIQFVLIRNRTHCRREVLSAMREIILDTIQSHVAEGINDQPGLPSEVTANCKVDEKYTVTYIVESIYKKLLQKLQIEKSEQEGMLKDMIKTYIVYIFEEVVKCVDSKYVKDWLDSFYM